MAVRGEEDFGKERGRQGLTAAAHAMNGNPIASSCGYQYSCRVGSSPISPSKTTGALVKTTQQREGSDAGSYGAGQCFDDNSDELKAWLSSGG
jgi:hypothetical protein